MAQLRKLLALIAVAGASPALFYMPVQWTITSETGLNGSPIVGSNFTITDIALPPNSDPSYKSHINSTQQMGYIQNGPLSGVEIIFSLPRKSQPPLYTIGITGTLVLQSSAFESSLTTAIFPGLEMTIDTLLDSSSMTLGGVNCFWNGVPNQMVCTGEDAYGVSISATLEHTSNPWLWELLNIQWNAE